MALLRRVWVLCKFFMLCLYHKPGHDANRRRYKRGRLLTLQNCHSGRWLCHTQGVITRILWHRYWPGLTFPSNVASTENLCCDRKKQPRTSFIRKRCDSSKSVPVMERIRLMKNVLVADPEFLNWILPSHVERQGGILISTPEWVCQRVMWNLALCDWMPNYFIDAFILLLCAYDRCSG